MHLLDWIAAPLILVGSFALLIGVGWTLVWVTLIAAGVVLVLVDFNATSRHTAGHHRP